MLNGTNDLWFGKDKLFHLVGSMVLVVIVYLLYGAVASDTGHLARDSYILTLGLGILKEFMFDDFVSIKDIVVDAIGASVIFLI